MSIWKTLFGGGSNPPTPVATPSTVSQQNNSSSAGAVTYVRTDKSVDSTYEIYRAANAETAKAFLLTKQVGANKHYIMVETSEGVWAVDKLGLYLEKLLPFQKNPEAASCDISAYGMPDQAGLEMAANGINESFVIKLRCGNCQHEWLDAVRYQTKTAVRCPKCKKVNRADTTNIHRVTIGAYPLFEKFLAGLPADGRSKASSAMSSVSLANEILGVYSTDDSFSAALQFAQSLPKHFHPIGMRFSHGGALYVRCAFTSAAEFNSVVSTLKRGCERIWTDPDEAHIALHGI